MGLFSKILSKLGIGDDKPTATTSASQTAVASAASPTSSSTAQAMPVVDVMAKLETMSKANPEQLNWQTSIVDLLKLLGLDSSLEARKDLAEELGCPAEKMSDSAQMNMWLHKAVMQKLAHNGGNIPADMLS